MRLTLKKKIQTPTEHDEQAAFFTTCRWRAQQDRRYQSIFAVPNAGKRSVGALLYYKAEGLESGVPDVCIPVPAGNYHGAFIEFKRPGGKLTDRQKVWTSRLAANGYAVSVQYSAEEASSWLVKYFNGEL